MDKFDVLSRGKINPGLFKNHRQVEEFTALLDQWIESGFNADGRETPQSRHLAEPYVPGKKADVSNPGKVVIRFLADHRVQVKVDRKSGVLTGDFGIVKDGRWVDYLFTLFVDSELGTMIHRCGYRACRKLFYKKPKSTPYPKDVGICCCVEHSRAQQARKKKTVNTTEKHLALYRLYVQEAEKVDTTTRNSLDEIVVAKAKKKGLIKSRKAYNKMMERFDEMEELANGR